MVHVPHAIIVAGICIFMLGCSGDSETDSPHVFLGVPEDETSGEGPVGLINGEMIQINDVSRVREVAREEYLSAKQAGNVIAEDEHQGYVYWAVKAERDVPFENATAWVTVLERYKSRLK